MKILSPVDHLEEVKVLLEAGADELYGGFVSPEWQERYGFLGSPNKRSFKEAQFRSVGELRRAVEIAHNYNVSFFLTLNNDYYSQEQYPHLLAEVEKAVELGVDALLVADLGLIVEVRRRGYPLDLHLSILAPVMNSEAAQFYHELGLSRVVLERSLTLAEISNILNRVKGLEFEVFIAYGKCPNIEGFCTHFHQDDPQRRWPCSWSYQIVLNSKSKIQKGEKREISNSASEAQAYWSKVKRGEACGLCAMYDLNKMGITSLKIAGRGRYTEHKLKILKLVVKMRRLLEGNINRKEFYQMALEDYEKTFGHRCNPYVCYFPEIRESVLLEKK